MRRTIVVFAVLGVTLLLAGCAWRATASTGLPAGEVGAGVVQSFPTETNDEAEVTVEVTPLNLDHEGEGLRFDVALNTHVVALDYDLTELASLRTDLGSEVAPQSWDGGQGGHHVKGTLTFPAANLKGAGRIEVVIRDVAGVPERVFSWGLP